MSDGGQSTTSSPASTYQQSTPTYPSLFFYLHRAVKCRIPSLPSLRRSYSAPNVQALANPDAAVAPLRIRDGPQPLQMTRTRQPRPISEGTIAFASGSEGAGSAHTLAQTEALSGIDWFTAETGLILVNRAYSQAFRKAEMTNSLAVRSQHIHGLVYLLRALPDDLEPVEVRQLQSALPVELQADWRSCPPRRGRGNVLSRSITFVMLQCAIFLSFLLPILMGLLDRFLQYEREHHVVQKLCASSGQVIASGSKRGGDLKEALVRFGQGRFGAALFRGVSWIAEGVVQGISEGAGRSAVIVGSAIAIKSDGLKR
jgi:hypothetical protein